MDRSNVGTINLQRQDPYLDGRQLDDLIGLWLDDCADRLDGIGPNGYVGTVRGYADKIVYFQLWWEETGPGSGWRLTQRLLREFERWLRQRPSRYGAPLMYHTRRDVLRRLRSMFRWAQMTGYIVNVAPADWVPAAVGDPPTRRPVSDAALTALLQAADESACPQRNRTILAILIGTGIRRAECAALNIEDVRFAADGTGTVLVRNPKRTKRGTVVREVAFDEATGDYLRRWLAGLARPTGPLFPSSTRGRHGGRTHLHPNSLGRIVRQIWEIAGLDADQPVHDLRRAFITDWRRRHRGADLDELLQRQVGHADAAMTSHYSLQGAEDVREVISSPMTRIGVPVDNWPV